MQSEDDDPGSNEKPVAVVVGASGGIGSAVAARLATDARYREVVRLSRAGESPLDLTDEPGIAAAAGRLAGIGDIRLVFVATGMLHDRGVAPEKRLKDIDPAAMARAFAVNATGPALLMKHFLPLMPRAGRSVFATLSARVGSIGDNDLGGWYAYRASKAALNQLVRTAAIELARRAPEAICVALHPGTVDTRLSSPFSRSGLNVRTPDAAAADLLSVIGRISPAGTGGFFDYRGERLPW